MSGQKLKKIETDCGMGFLKTAGIFVCNEAMFFHLNPLKKFLR